MKERRFREDLYYRLNVIPIHIPPLRERTGDIPLLVRHFVDKFGAAGGRQVRDITPEALAKLERHPWPGNVRELENMIERIVVLKHGEVIDVGDLPEFLAGRTGEGAGAAGEGDDASEIPLGGISFKRAVADFEARLIRQALDQTGGNKNKAATLLKLNRTTLVEKIKKRKVDAEA